MTLDVMEPFCASVSWSVKWGLLWYLSQRLLVRFEQPIVCLTQSQAILGEQVDVCVCVCVCVCVSWSWVLGSIRMPVTEDLWVPAASTQPLPTAPSCMHSEVCFLAPALRHGWPLWSRDSSCIYSLQGTPTQVAISSGSHKLY